MKKWNTEKPWQLPHITQLGRAGLSPAIDARAHTPKNYANNSHLRDDKTSTLEWTLCLNLQCKVIQAERERRASFPKATNKNIRCFVSKYSGRSPCVRAATKVNNERVSQSQEKIHHISTEPCSGMRVMLHSNYHILRVTLINWEIQKLPARSVEFRKSMALRNS